MKYLYRLFLLPVLSIILLSAAGTAQEPGDSEKSGIIPEKENMENTETGKEKSDDKSIKLDTIVITATRSKERIKDVPVHVDVITAKDIEDTGMDSLGDIIGQKITGHYHRFSGLSQPAGLMGNLATDTMGDATGSRVILLVDGHRIGTANIAKIPVEIIERIEVIKGPASALYGSDAMGGVINIITKKGKGDIQNTVQIETGSFDYSKTAVTSGGRINDLSGYFITAGYSQTGDYRTKRYGTVYNSAESRAQVWGNLSVYPSDKQSLRIGFSYADLISHYPAWNNYNENTYYDDTAKDYSDLGRGHADLEYNIGLLQNKLNWKASAYFLFDKRSWFYGTSGKTEDDANIYNDYTTGTDQQLEFSIPANKVVLGYTFEILKRDTVTKVSGTTTANTTPDFNYYTNSVYLQDTASFGKNLLIILGARYDKFDLETDGSGAAPEKVSNDNISPRGGIVLKAADLLRIRSNAGCSFRAPNADELAMDNRSSWGNYEGNPDLKPETGLTYDAGFDVYPGDFNLGATYSYIKTKNFITYKYSHTDSDGDWYVYENLDKAKMEIIDCYVNWNVGDTFGLPAGLNLSSNITFNKKAEDMTTGDDLPFVPNMEIKSNIQIIYKSLTVTMSHVYVGKESLKNGDEKESFYYLDLTSGYSISPNFSVNAGVFNISNKDYAWVDGYPMPERNYKIGITGKF